MRELVCLLVLMIFLAGFPAAADEAMDNPAYEARAVAIGNELRCVVCQSQSINDSQADMARNMRILVRTKIQEGWSDQEIYAYIRSRYGDFILLRPPFQQNTWLLWLCPIIFMGLAGGWIGRSLYRRLPRS